MEEPLAELWDVPEARAVLDSMTEYFVALDGDYNIVFTNRSLTEATTPHLGSIVGRNHWEIWPEMRGTIVEETYRRALVTLIPTRFEYFFPPSEIWIEVDVHPVPGRLHVYFRDITAQRKSEAARVQEVSQMRAMIDSIPQIAWASDSDRTPTYLNGRWWEYTGHRPDEPFATRSAIHPDDVGIADSTLHNLPAEPVEAELRLRRYDGEHRWHLIRTTPWLSADGTLLGYFGTSTDVHERRLAEEAMRRNEIELERRVQERTAEVEAAHRRQEAWNYSVSHDLRAPLRAIISTATMLQEDYADEISEAAARLLTRQAKAARKLANLVDDLLKTARLARRTMTVEPIDLSDLALEVVAEQLARLERKVSITVEPAMTAVGDRQLIHLVLANLIENAIKYTGEESVIEVGQTLWEGETAFFVRDNGIGFDMAYAAKVWLPFERLVLDQDYPGTGIGLFNVASMLERMGGRAWVQSEPGVGSTFYFTLK